MLYAPRIWCLRRSSIIPWWDEWGRLGCWAYSVALSLKKRISRFLQRTVWNKAVEPERMNFWVFAASDTVIATTVRRERLVPLRLAQSITGQLDGHSISLRSGSLVPIGSKCLTCTVFPQKTVISMYAHRKRSNSGLHLDRQLAVEYDPGMPQRWILLEALASLKHGPPGWVATPSMALSLRCRLKTYSV